MAKRDSNFNPIGSSRGVRREGGGTADFMSCSPQTLQRAIALAASTGGALRFGYSRDGGAYAIGIYGDGDPYTEFVRPHEDLDAFIEKVCDLYESIADDRASAQGAKKGAKSSEAG